MDTISFGEFELDLATRELEKEDGYRTILRKRDFDLLVYLLEHPLRTISRDELSQEVWHKVVEDNTINKAIGRLRQHLGDSEKPYRYISTERGVGVKFLVEPEDDVDLRYSFVLESPALVVRGRLNVADHVFLLNAPDISHQIDVLGFSLYNSWFRRYEFKEAVSRRLSTNDLTLRVLLPSPESPFLQRIELDRQYDQTNREFADDDTADFRSRRQKTIEFLKKFGTTDRTVLGILEEESVCTGIVRFDNIIILGINNFPFRGGDHAYVLLNKREQPTTPAEKDAGELFDIYKRTFDTLWRIAEKPKLSSL